MISSATGGSEGVKKERNLCATSCTSSSPTPDNRFDILFPSYSQSMFSGLLDGDLLDEELNGKFACSSVYQRVQVAGWHVLQAHHDPPCIRLIPFDFVRLVQLY
jgi:hypothetical protein